MKKIVVFGNSGSGKSTLARDLSVRHGLAHLDLDTLAWQEVAPPQRALLSESEAKIAKFIESNEDWVIEGCYSDLLSMAIDASSEIIFLNLPVLLCVANARNRPWEPHKYESKAAQDANLEMLLSWIAEYPVRDDEFSQAAHQAIYDGYSGPKSLRVTNVDSGPGDAD